MRSHLAGLTQDAAAIVGAGLIIEGADLIYRPVAFIIAGGFVLVGAWLTARKVR